ncbi:glycosyltransferase family 4 protein [Roseivivax lentus]|nr:glycosyltransferase family 4 protein [Roseivivax lentus]
MARALEEQAMEIVGLGPLQAPALPLHKAYAKIRRTFGLPRLSPFHAAPVARQFATDAERKISDAEVDMVFAPAGSTFARGTPPDVPLVYTSDATFKLVENYHPNYRNLSRRARIEIDALERDSISRADLLLYPTEWAAQSAMEDYGADPALVHVIPWGANLMDAPDRETALRERAHTGLRLLFVGVDWAEKGAAIAIEALDCLRAQGIDARLTICGCSPPHPVDRDGLEIIPFLDKQNPEEMKRLTRLFDESDFFILPTRADCYGIVFCEAAAYGLPSIAPATGGVPGVVLHGTNGILVDPDAPGRDYAAAIAALLADPGRISRLRESTRNRYEAELNWSAWGQRVGKLMASL